MRTAKLFKSRQVTLHPLPERNGLSLRVGNPWIYTVEIMLWHIEPQAWRTMEMTQATC